MKRIITAIALLAFSLAAYAQGGGFKMPPMPENVAYFEYNMNMGQIR